MTLLTEGDLQVTLDDAVDIRKFDGDEHGLSHCMKAVDFVVEFDDRYLFIELKDPQDPDVPAERKLDVIEDFRRSSIDNELIGKYRDSFLYEWASGRADKPIQYFVLIALDDMQAGDLAVRTSSLQRAIPLSGPGGEPWVRPFVSECAVFNIESWNRRFPRYPLRRLSEDLL